MDQCEDDLHLSDLAERVERAVLPVPPGAWVQKPAGADDLLAMTGCPPSKRLSRCCVRLPTAAE